MRHGKDILRAYRQKQGLSPAEFAKKLGVAEVTVRSLENGTRNISPERAKLIEVATGGALKRAQLCPEIFA